nr:type IV secretion system protein [Ectothiorhodospira sp. PHS-1]
MTTWLLAYAGIFFLGFGGSRWTSDMAINYYKTVLGVAVQIMTMVLLVGIGNDMLSTFYARMNQNVLNIEELGVMLVFCMALLLLVNWVPPMVGGVITGAGIGSGGGIGNFGTGAAVGAVMGAAGMAAGAAGFGGNSESGAKRAVSLAAGTAGNLAKGIGAAAAEKIKDRVADTAGGRLASSLRARTPSFEGNSLAGTAEHTDHNKSDS